MRPNFNPYEHQCNGVEWLMKKRGGVLAWDVGTGKTLTALCYFDNIKKIEPSARMLVVAPMSLINSAWVQDIEEFTEFTHSCVKDKKYNKEADIHIINYESLWRSSQQSKLKELTAVYPTTLVLDEAGKIRNHRSQVSKYLSKTLTWYETRVAMSGTIAPNSELEYWSACNVTLPGCVPPNFYIYRNKYFCLSRGDYHVYGRMNSSQAHEMLRQGYKYVVYPNKEDELKNMLSRCINVVKKEDCLDLPEIIDTQRYVELSKEEKNTYKQMYDQYIVDLDNNEEVVATTALTKVMKLRQITSGFVYDATGKPHVIGNSKIKEILSILDDNKGIPVIIWSSFKHQITKIKEAVPNSTIAAGGSDTEEALRKFMNREVDVLIASPRSIGHGVDGLQKICSLMIFESLDYSFDLWEQCRGRLHRNKQENKVTTLTLTAKGTIDEAVLMAVKNKADKQELLEWIKNNEITRN